MIEIYALRSFGDTVTEEWLANMRESHEACRRNLTDGGVFEEAQLRFLALDLPHAPRDRRGPRQPLHPRYATSACRTISAWPSSVHRRPGFRSACSETIDEHLRVITRLERHDIDGAVEAIEAHFRFRRLHPPHLRRLTPAEFRSVLSLCGKLRCRSRPIVPAVPRLARPRSTLRQEEDAKLKITKVETFQLAWDEAKKARAAFVRIETEDGQFGLGEATRWRAVLAHLNVIATEMAPFLVGKDALDHAVLVDTLYHVREARPEGVVTGALAAIDIAPGT